MHELRQARPAGRIGFDREKIRGTAKYIATNTAQTAIEKKASEEPANRAKKTPSSVTWGR